MKSKRARPARSRAEKQQRRFLKVTAVWSVVTLVAVFGFSWIGYEAFNSGDAALDRSEVPQWIVAITSSLTLVAVVVAGLFGYRTLQVELSRDRDREMEKLSEQAARIAAWPLVEFAADAYIGERPTTLPPKVALANLSDLPVTRVVVRLRVQVSEEEGLRNLGGTIVSQLTPTRAGEEREVPILVHPSFPQQAPPDAHAEWVIWLSFVDAFGRFWIRTPDGLTSTEIAD